MSDTEMLKKILDVWTQPFTGDPEKTVGAWRSEMAAVLNEALAHWQRTHPPTQGEEQ